MSSKYAFTKTLKEVRFLFCQTSEHSAATRYVLSPGPRGGERLRLTERRTRSFLTRAYPTMKRNNPQTPIMLREAAGTLPKVYARYGPSVPAAAPATIRATRANPGAEFGSEKQQSLEGLSDKQIEDAVTGLVKNDA